MRVKWPFHFFFPNHTWTFACDEEKWIHATASEDVVLPHVPISHQMHLGQRWMALIQWSLDWIWVALSVVFSGKLDVQVVVLWKVPNVNYYYMVKEALVQYYNFCKWKNKKESGINLNEFTDAQERNQKNGNKWKAYFDQFLQLRFAYLSWSDNGMVRFYLNE